MAWLHVTVERSSPDRLSAGPYIYACSTTASLRAKFLRTKLHQMRINL
jgi:hypothetical protein